MADGRWADGKTQEFYRTEGMDGPDFLFRDLTLHK
jgi:hypothetical protein